ncbi:MAG TPA: VCBS repeat-containing protein, partial [Acidobacteriaceae bacterium]|nr:VCBS repeat-containing protein [Acidobacteriaceae bacterium]
MSLRATISCCFSLLVFVGMTACRQAQPGPAEPRQSSNPASPSQKATSADMPTPPAVTRPSGPIRFVDVTQAAGIHFRHNSGAYGKKYLPETMGSGVCVIDYDGDGWQDILFVNSMDWPEHKTSISTPALYHNNHDGTFTDVTRASGLAKEMYGLGCAVGDFDNDGRDDIYITALGGNYLFRNLGGGHFADVTAKAHVKDAGFSTGAVWFDYDN